MFLFQPDFRDFSSVHHFSAQRLTEVAQAISRVSPRHVWRAFATSFQQAMNERGSNDEGSRLVRLSRISADLRMLKLSTQLYIVAAGASTLLGSPSPLGLGIVLLMGSGYGLC